MLNRDLCCLKNGAPKGRTDRPISPQTDFVKTDVCHVLNRAILNLAARRDADIEQLFACFWPTISVQADVTLKVVKRKL